MGVWWWRDVAAAVDGCVQLLWRQIGFSLSEPHNQSLSSPIPTTPTHSSPVILSLFDLLQLRAQSLQCCSKPEKRFDPLFIMLLTPVSGYNGIQHIWGGTISVTSNWRPMPGMYCLRHPSSLLSLHWWWWCHIFIENQLKFHSISKEASWKAHRKKAWQTHVSWYLEYIPSGTSSLLSLQLWWGSKWNQSMKDTRFSLGLNPSIYVLYSKYQQISGLWYQSQFLSINLAIPITQ